MVSVVVLRHVNIESMAFESPVIQQRGGAAETNALETIGRLSCGAICALEAEKWLTTWALLVCHRLHSLWHAGTAMASMLMPESQG